MRNLVVLAIVFSVLAVPTAARALSLYSQGYNFNVRVTNKSFKTINHARGNVWISGNRAQIEIKADGYRSTRETVYIRENQKYYNVNARMDDPGVFFRVYNASYQTIPGAYARENNIGVWGDEYRFDIRLPKEGYEEFDSFDVEVDCTGGFVFGERINVYNMGSQRRVEITVKRRNMNDFSNTFKVTIPSDEELRGHRRKLIRTISYKLMNEKEELGEELAEKLAEKLAGLKNH